MEGTCGTHAEDQHLKNQQSDQGCKTGAGKHESRMHGQTKHHHPTRGFARKVPAAKKVREADGNPERSRHH